MKREGKDRKKGYFNQEKETRDPEKRKESLEKSLKAIIKHGYKNSKAIKTILDKAGATPDDINTLEDLEKLPITNKADLLDRQKREFPFGGFEAVPLEEIRRIYVSPGFIYEPGEMEYKDTRLAEALFASGFRKGDIIVNTFNYHLWPFSFMLDESLKMIGCTVVPTGPGNTHMQVTIIQHLKANGFIGTPSFLMTISERAEGMGIDLKKDFPLETAFVSAEMLPESLRKRLEEKTGITISQAYATVDLGCIGYECPNKNGLHIPEDVIVEIINPDTGKKVEPGAVGEVVVTTFNKTFPLIRFGTGDLSSFMKEKCECGRTSLKLLKILGRTDQATKIRGTFVHPWQTDELMGKFHEVYKYQMVVTRKEHKDEITFFVELKEEPVDKVRLKAQIEKMIKEMLNLRGKVEIVPKGYIPEWHKKIEDKRSWE